MLFQPLFDFFFSSIQFNNIHSKNIKEKTTITDILAIIDASLYQLLYIILTNLKLSRYKPTHMSVIKLILLF
jgi:hypothetical protein